MAKRGLKIFGIGVGTLVVIVGVIVGILVATGTIGKTFEGLTSSSLKSSTSNGNCEQMPNVTSFQRVDNNTFRISFTPISGDCTTTKNWSWQYTFNGYGPNGIHIQSSDSGSFQASSGQSFVDINFEAPYNNPYSPVGGSITGEVWLQTTNADGTGDLLSSNKLPYVVMLNN